MNSSFAAAPESAPGTHCRRRILVVIDNLEIGGVQEFIVLFCARMKHLAITVVSLTSLGHYQQRLESTGARVLALVPEYDLSDRRWRWRTAWRLRSFLVSFFRLRDFLRAESSRFDRIYLHLFRTFIYATLLGRYRDPKFVGTIACTTAQLSWPVRWFYRLFARHYAEFRIPEEIREFFVEFRIAPERERKMQNFVQRHPDFPSHPVDGSIRLLSAGRLIAQKGHADAIRLQAALDSLIAPQKAKLLVIGDGPERARLAALCANRPGVELRGATLQFSEVLAGTQVFVKFAQGEGINSVVRECLCAGIMVATTLETNFCREVADRGWVVPLWRDDIPRSAASLWQALSAQTEESRRSLRAAALEYWNDEKVISDYP